MRQIPPVERKELQGKVCNLADYFARLRENLDPLTGMLVMTDVQFNAALDDAIGAIERMKGNEK
jgi:hypothetical protein